MYDKEYYQRIYQQTEIGPNVYSKHVMDCCMTTARALKEYLRPKTVLDIGCGLGYLVAAFRSLGVDAYGFDISEDANQYRLASAKPFCWVDSLTDFSTAKYYDLIICIEVLEHVPFEQAAIAIAKMSSMTNNIAFSSDQEFIDEPTHVNVQNQEYWDDLFALYDFWRIKDEIKICPTWGVLYEYC